MKRWYVRGLYGTWYLTPAFGSTNDISKAHKFTNDELKLVVRREAKFIRSLKLRLRECKP